MKDQKMRGGRFRARAFSRQPPLAAQGRGDVTRSEKVPSLARYFPIARVEEEALVRADGTPVAALEVMGTEVEEATLLGFAAALNALDFPVQLLVRQHPPSLGRLREEMNSTRPSGLAPALQQAATSLERFLAELEERDGVLDRRFYALCHAARGEELKGFLSGAGLSVFPLQGRALHSFTLASALGTNPGATAEDEFLVVTLGRNIVTVGHRVSRSYHLSRWPRSLAPGFLQRLFSLGVPLDLSLHVVPIPLAQAARTLEWQKVKFESATALSLRRGRTPSLEAEIALEDITRLREELHRGRERLFHASLSLTIYSRDRRSLRERGQRVQAYFSGVLASLDGLPFRQRQGHLSTMPLALNSLGSWRTLDTSTLAHMFPFAPPDLDTRRGSLFGLDLRSGSPVTFDPFDAAFLNANMAVLARSGAGKSFSTKLALLRGVARGIVYHVIDPEGEYVALAKAAGGRVLSPGMPGHGLNPFVVERGDEGELLQRVGGLRRLVEVMVGERLRPEQRAVLDHALTAYYADGRPSTGFQDLFRFLEGNDATPGFGELAALLRPFATGSLRYLLSDRGEDLLAHEAAVTVFNLRHLEPELRPAATMVCAEAVWAMATRDPRPRVLVVDEVWSIMQHPEGASHLVSMAKRARKHQLGLVSITQDVQDFLGQDASRPIVGHSGRVLLQNSAFKLLLQQDAAALGSVQEAFNLSPSDAQWLLSCLRGDGLFIARSGRFPVRIQATPQEYRLIEGKGGDQA